ncbi:MAG: hypothetical protein GWN84_24495 [Gammaproteobacteria bacterium]|nr:hypothetical protein [Gammaproteobacteria bacterium]NIR85745.1 hypothetical protein [Gammaproteobacteria bacterium]NIR90278.1 hypothetical protein [Gammaproteobacteria bacterium]NIU06879.1 hypothetical protein [Gammaproteobacteria bacterium]NIV53812.1 hypothetical protein [Gammaproteobacteria bacterium]
MALMALLAAPATGQQMFFYPAQGQSAQQQSKDQAECNAWAAQQTGYNPMRSQAAPPQQAQQGGAVRGAARGAAVGAVGGAIGGDAGKGAAIGAGVGALIGAMRRADQRAQQEQAQRQHEQQQAQARGAYERAMRACMEGRGYSAS